MGNFKTQLECSNCHEHWMVGDRERTNEEKRKWLCPKCQELVAKIRSDEAKVDELEQAEIQSPKDEPEFYNE